MKEYVVDFIFRVYVNAENESEAISEAEESLLFMNTSDYDRIEIEEIEEWDYGIRNLYPTYQDNNY